ncbi:MAG: SDR family NAD(P)-dependent oxidoreductase, partial [Candidatus Methylomirabilis sp.]|nr:SDR family NAD(P)-dependent oxidoreductase [Deltaproteobacteria bacterium]
GADVVLADLNEGGLAPVAAEIDKLGRRTLSVRTDVSRKEEVAALAEEAIAWQGGVDLVMNNAGVAVRGHIEAQSLEDWEWIVGINLWGVVYGVHAFLPHMLERGRGHFVNVASLAGLIGAAGLASYSTTKFAVVGLTEALRAETHYRGVSATVVCPGFIRTNIVRAARIASEGEGEADRALIDRLKRQPEDLARKIVRSVKRDALYCLHTPEAYALTAVKRASPTLYGKMLHSTGPRIDAVMQGDLSGKGSKKK